MAIFYYGHCEERTDLSTTCGARIIQNITLGETNTTRCDAHTAMNLPLAA